MKFTIFTTGCKANQWDSYVIHQRLKEAGLSPSAQGHADLAVINGCTLTERAEADIRRFISRTRTTGRDVKIVLAGCHGQVYPEKAFGADLVLGQEEKFRSELYISSSGVVRQATRDFSMEKSSFNGSLPGRTRVFFKIQDGCDRFCTYCIVPFSRGRVRSRPADEIREGMRLLKEKGVMEVVLTGIDIAFYRDPSCALDLRGLLRLLESAETPPRIRLSSVDPAYIDKELAAVMASSKKLAPSLHIPLQSGNEEILKKMGRNYSAESIRSTMEMLKGSMETVGIGMDVMVGFPGEDDRAFRDTVHLLESLPVSYLHVFPYSDRKGTRAYEMGDKVADAVKRERVRVLKVMDATKRAVFYGGFVGKQVRIIPEGKVYKGAYLRGYTDNYIPVYVPFEKSIENKVVHVTIKSMQSNTLIGER
jgi:threonylcarbamoyladenosine tRNA methylthiotransferase MtaB